jgi:predicted metal-binding membrane protein
MPPDFMSLSGQPEGRGDGGLRLSRDRGVWLTGGLLIAIAALAWVAVVRHGMGRQGTPPAQLETGMVGMSQANVASPVDATAYLVAWGVMMAAMMLPSATPMIALYGAISRNSSHSGQKGASTILFALVYLAAWLALGLPVYAASRLVDWAAVMVPAVGGLFPYAVAAVLLAAGAFQFSPLKQACLRVCQSPLGFLMGHWRAGHAGTLKMAWEHAAYCAGCCWGTHGRPGRGRSHVPAVGAAHHRPRFCGEAAALWPVDGPYRWRSAHRAGPACCRAARFSRFVARPNHVSERTASTAQF